MASDTPEDLNELTVAQLKEELRSRDVYFSSKLKKQELCDLLAASRHLPRTREETPKSSSGHQQKKSKKTKGSWPTDLPVRKLLYFEFKEGKIPLDPNDMGPAEIYCKYHDKAELQGIDYNQEFIQCLKALRACIMKEDPLLEWNQ